MTRLTGSLRGVIKGKLIELEEATGLADGQAVSVSIRPALAPGEGLRRAFGGWAQSAVELDQFLEQVRLDRKLERREPTS